MQLRFIRKKEEKKSGQDMNVDEKGCSGIKVTSLRSPQRTLTKKVVVDQSCVIKVTTTNVDQKGGSRPRLRQ